MGQRTPHVKGQPAESPTSPSTSHTGHSSLPHGPWEPTCLLVSGVSGRVGPGPCSEGKKMGTPGTWQQWRGFSGVAGVAPGLELGPSLHVHTSPPSVGATDPLCEPGPSHWHGTSLGCPHTPSRSSHCRAVLLAQSGKHRPKPPAHTWAGGPVLAKLQGSYLGA